MLKPSPLPPGAWWPWTMVWARVSLPGGHTALTPRLWAPMAGFHPRACRHPEKRRDLHQRHVAPCLFRKEVRGHQAGPRFALFPAGLSRSLKPGVETSSPAPHCKYMSNFLIVMRGWAALSPNSWEKSSPIVRRTHAAGVVSAQSHSCCGRQGGSGKQRQRDVPHTHTYTCSHTCPRTDPDPGP